MTNLSGDMRDFPRMERSGRLDAIIIAAQQPEYQYKSAQVQYELMFNETTASAKHAKVQMDSLVEATREKFGDRLERGMKEGGAVSFDSESGLTEEEQGQVSKLLFMAGQVSLAEALIKELVSQKAAWEVRDFMNTPDASEYAGRTLHLEKATGLLQTLDLSFRHVTILDPNKFAPIFEASWNIIKTHPKLCAGAVVVPGLVGGVGGVYGLGGIGFRAFLTWLFGDATALGGAAIKCARGAAVGGLAGFALGAIFIGLVIVYQRHHSRSAPDQELKDMKAKIQEIAKRDLILKDLDELEDLFNKAYSQPMQQAVCDETCLVCLAHFPPGGENRDERPIKSRNCQGYHWLHRKCLMEWQAASGNDRCVYCRQ